MDVVESRLTSGLSLSIATSHAMETFIPSTKKPFDKDRVIPTPPHPLQHYRKMYVSVLTLLRNMLGAIEHPVDRLTPTLITSFVNALFYEMELIHSIINEVSNKGCAVEFYTNDQQSLLRNKKIHPYMRMASTKKQRQQQKIINVVINTLLADPRGGEINNIDGPVTIRTRGAAIIVTHMPYELLRVSRFQEVVLLESHTGVVKSKKDWYTKLYPVPKTDISMLPFIPSILLIFGDRVSFKPNTISLRRAIVTLAHEKKWNYLTTQTKVTADIMKSPTTLSDVYQHLPKLSI